jgi:hypothetical protein
VKDKTFASLPVDGDPCKVSVKFGASHEVAMLIPGAAPTDAPPTAATKKKGV